MIDNKSSTDGAAPVSKGRTGRGEAWVLGQVILLAAIALVPRHIPGLPAWPESLVGISMVIGVVLGLAGVILISLSALALGKNLTVFPRPKDNGALTQSGVYGIVRHPMYGSVLLMALGWSLFWTNLAALLLSLVLGLFFDRKAHREEGWLEQKYPDYGAYRQRVHKLIPWIY